MGKTNWVDFPHPSGGVDRSKPYGTQPPQTVPGANNVWPRDSFHLRDRIGSRPGLVKQFYDQIGSGNPIVMLSEVTMVRDDGIKYWSDYFDSDTLSTVWSVGSWSGTIPTIIENTFSVATAVGTTTAVRDDLTEIDVTKFYRVGIYIVPYRGKHHGKFRIFCQMDTTTPVATTDGIEVILADITGTGSGTVTVNEYNGGSKTEKTAAAAVSVPNQAMAGWFEVESNGTTFNTFWLGEQISSVTMGAAAGRRFGFGIECTEAGGRCLVDQFRVQYNPDTEERKRAKIVVASSNGEVWRSKYSNSLEKITVTPKLATDRNIQATSQYQKLYIADEQFRTRKTDGLRGTGNNRLDTTVAFDFSAVGIVKADDIVVITNGSANVTNGNYQITTIGTSEMTLASNWCTTAGDSCTFRIERGIKVYDPGDDSLALHLETSGKGVMPIGCRLIALYRDRMVLSGLDQDPHEWFMSKQGDNKDFDYIATGNGRAINGANSDAGKIGDVVTALIPHSDDYLVFGCLNSIWVLRGDPAFGGELNNIDRDSGVASAQSWCKGPLGEIVFVGRNGLYIIPPGGVAQPQEISRHRLPDEMIRLDPTQYDIFVAYDVTLDGIHVYASQIDKAGGDQHWWFDMKSAGFWPIELTNTHEPTSILSFASENTLDSSILLGGRDGYVRKFSRFAEHDDGTIFKSRVILGPLRAGGHNGRDGKVKAITGVVAKSSGDIDWDLYVGNDQESVVDDAMDDGDSTTKASTTSTWKEEGLAYTRRPSRARGGALAIKLRNGETNRSWAVERVSVELIQSGRQRRL